MHLNLIVENLIEILIPVLLVPTVFGIFLTLLSTAILLAVVPAKLRCRLSLYRWIISPPAMILIPLTGCLLGIVTGYYSEWWSHNFDPVYTGAGEPWWTIFGAPGDIVANSYGGDWQADEAWDYRGDIMFWNGLFWTILAFGTSMTFRIFVRLVSSLNSSLTIAKPPLLT
ncbi:MAG TPA: hypothetical protein VNN22_20470 [Verrucomicrobiae bacterium]|nr:hypothetical protein [Verrucomicrobiae bacterium]